MKTNVIIIGVIFLLGLTINLRAQIRFSTETTLCYDKSQGGIPLNRLEIQHPQFNIKYDYKVDLINNAPVNDVFGIFFPKIINKKNFKLGGALIKLGDWNQNDQIIFDITAEKKFKHLLISWEVGRVIGVKTQPWDFIISRISHRLFTVEGAIFSPDWFLAPSSKKLYGWVAYHPRHFFLAVGNEISRNWFIVGTKNYQRFGNFTFMNYDRDNGNFWFRSQFGFKNVNQKFFSQENYLIAASYLIVPPFFYRHFSPMSTKGLYALKLDGKRVGKLETYEVSIGRQFGRYGQICLGINNENFLPNRIGWIVEYYKEFCLKNFQAITELRYEQLTGRFYGYITLVYQLQ
ncbi:MAG: hypothetical protein WC523_05750 [Patescibacteria group bacterium]|jgi:hypothetical protein